MLLCSVIIGVIAVFVCYSFVSFKDGNPTPLACFYSCLGLLALSSVSAMASVLWLLVTITQKPD